MTVDYVLIGKKDVKPNMNENEVSELKYCDFNEIKSMCEASLQSNSSIEVSPWFLLLQKNFLENWWQQLNDITNSNYKIDTQIHNFLEKK